MLIGNVKVSSDLLTTKEICVFLPLVSLEIMHLRISISAFLFRRYFVILCVVCMHVYTLRGRVIFFPLDLSALTEMRDKLSLNLWLTSLARLQASKLQGLCWSLPDCPTPTSVLGFQRCPWKSGYYTDTRGSECRFSCLGGKYFGSPQSHLPVPPFFLYGCHILLDGTRSL